jgi:1,2-diacylglycerol 3-beta-galactosyltransferase
LVRVPKADFVFFDAGGGHRAAATALCLLIARQNRPWEVRLVNLQELLDPLDLARKWFGTRLQDVYNLFLKKRWTLGSPQLLRLLQAIIRLYHRQEVDLLERYWQTRKPDLVVSFVPHFNRALCESLSRACPGTPFVTVLTDLADYPPHFWIERQRQYLVCGTDKAVAQALALGHTRERVFRVSGMILHPRFYEPIPVEREAERRKLGLDPSLPTGLLLFGGQGSPVMADIVRRLDRSGLDLQLVAICGHNDRLRRRLAAMKTRFPLCVEGFTNQVPYYMHLSDFFIGKPGPGSISEALAMKLPVIVERNAWTLPQERYNADWILEHGVGIVVPTFRRITRAVTELLQPGRLAALRARAAALNNRAVFELPEILARILAAGP